MSVPDKLDNDAFRKIKGYACSGIGSEHCPADTRNDPLGMTKCNYYTALLKKRND
jgi:hypothetical protein